MNFNILGGFQKILGGSSQIGLYLEIISMHLRVFSEGQGTEWRIFLGCLNFKYLLEVLEMHVCLFLLGGGGEQ